MAVEAACGNDGERSAAQMDMWDRRAAIRGTAAVIAIMLAVTAMRTVGISAQERRIPETESISAAEYAGETIVPDTEQIPADSRGIYIVIGLIAVMAAIPLGILLIRVRRALGRRGDMVPSGTSRPVGAARSGREAGTQATAPRHQPMSPLPDATKSTEPDVGTAVDVRTTAPERHELRAGVVSSVHRVEAHPAAKVNESARPPVPGEGARMDAELAAIRHERERHASEVLRLLGRL